MSEEPEYKPEDVPIPEHMTKDLKPPPGAPTDEEGDA